MSPCQTIFFRFSKSLKGTNVTSLTVISLMGGSNVFMDLSTCITLSIVMAILLILLSLEFFASSLYREINLNNTYQVSLREVWEVLLEELWINLLFMHAVLTDQAGPLLEPVRNILHHRLLQAALLKPLLVF